MRMYLAAAAVGVMTGLSGVQAEPVTTSGIGLTSCEKLARDIKPELGFNHVPNTLIYFWVQGYMSAANIATLEGDSQYVDLSQYRENVILAGVKQFCTEHPDKKPISYIDDILNKADKIKAGEWKKGTVPWAAD